MFSAFLNVHMHPLASAKTDQTDVKNFYVTFTYLFFPIIRYARTLKHPEKIFTFRVLVFYLEK